MKIGDVPFDQLKIGDKVISCTGKPGVIAALYPEKDLFGNDYGDWGGGILFLWRGVPSGWSIAGWSQLEVEIFDYD